MKKRSLVGLVVAALASLAAVLWVARWPAPADPGVLDASGRIEGDQAAYYLEIGLGVFLKGVGMDVLWPQAVAMGALGMGMLALGLWRFGGQVR